MAYMVTELAKISGVSVRTLRWYDEIGLLKPAYHGANNYRYYEEAQLLLLQQILFFRELGFNLNDIQKLLAQNDFDNVNALYAHRKVLEEDIARKNSLLVTIDKTIQHLRGKRIMKCEELYFGFDKKIDLPELLEGNKSPALNGTGYVYYTISPVGEDFLRDIKDGPAAGKNVIDIGAGYSNVPIEALKLGVSKYIANDISEEYLYLLVQRAKEVISEKALNNLMLIHGKAPHDLPLGANAYDAILAEKVMHFMTPSDIKAFLAWTHESLKPGGKIYVTVSSPYAKRYSGMLEEYHRRVATGEAFPGHFTNMMNTINKSAENYSEFTIPNEMLLFSRKDLVQLFENSGMQVVASYALQKPTAIEAGWKIVPDEESNLVGIVAMKSPTL
jgi:DNA-binding transcriptional MerR regulator/predicted SAM-dependent methyltransferase